MSFRRSRINAMAFEKIEQEYCGSVPERSFVGAGVMVCSYGTPRGHVDEPVRSPVMKIVRFLVHQHTCESVHT